MRRLLGDRTRWRPFSLRELGGPMLAFSTATALAVFILLVLGPDPEDIGRVGAGVLAAVFLSITPLLFGVGFMAAESARPASSARSRMSRSAVCGALYVLGWLTLAWVFERVDYLWEVPNTVGVLFFFSYWFIGPILLPFALWRAWRGVPAARGPASQPEGAA